MVPNDLPRSWFTYLGTKAFSAASKYLGTYQNTLQKSQLRLVWGVYLNCGLRPWG